MFARGFHGRRWRPELSAEAVLLICSAYLAIFANTAFWKGALEGRSLHDWHTWGYGAAVVVALVALHFVTFALFATRRTVRPLLIIVTLTSALANHFMQRYGIVLDASMVRNVLHTDAREATELMTAGTLAGLLWGAIPAAFLCRVRLRPVPRSRALALRIAAISAAVIAVLAAILCVYQDFASLMRNHKSLRYTINPASLVWSLSQVVADDTRGMREGRDPPEPAHRTHGQVGSKPTLLVMVVGETARAANFSLNGYGRLTNPELARKDVINFPHAHACGTSTEVSLPCMFSPFGRTDYDAARIRRHESLLHVLSHAGLGVIWLDNQSGCKGVCDGLEFRDLVRERVAGLCADARCYDAILVDELERVTANLASDAVVVLHQAGNHGPAYFRRYPGQFKRFLPACEKDELRDCSHDEIVNAYDNAITYTDSLLAGIIGHLEQLQSRFDVAMVYASDHGESLGEKGLYLHGMPYAIAPDEQLRVPMLWWLPETSATGLGIDAGCFRAKAAGDVSHDNLYHSVMGLLGVGTPRYRPERDLFSGCRRELRA